MTRIPRVRRAPRLLAALLALAACTDQSRSPIGVELLPEGILGGPLEVVTVREFSRAVDYPLFPAERGFQPRLFTALEWPAAPGFESRALMRFDLTELDSLDPGSTLLEGAVRLTYGPVPRSDVTLTLHRVTSEWDQVGATWTQRQLGVPWQTPGGDFDPDPLATVTLAGAPAGDDSLGLIDSVAVPIPIELVEDWLSGAVPNFGLALVQQTPGERVPFSAREGALGGTNPLGPTLELVVQLEGGGPLPGAGRILAAEDTFLPFDAGAFLSPELLVTGAEPIHRVVIVPDLAAVPPGATVARAQLIFSVDETRLAADSLQIVATTVLSEFRGEKTVFGPLSNQFILGVATLETDSLPVDSIVFESLALTRRVRDWLREPETNLGIGLLVVEAEQAFGGVSLFGPDAAPALRPRLRLVVVPAAVPADAEAGS